MTASLASKTTALFGLKNDGLVGLETDGLVGLENDGLVGLETDGLVGLAASPWSSMTIVSSSLKADPTGCTQIMSKPGEVGSPVSSPIPACLLPGQPSRRRGPPLVQGG